MPKDLYNSIMVVPIDSVKPLKPEAFYTTRKLVAILDKDGQIVPMQVKVLEDGTYSTFENSPYDDDRIYAARFLKWPTLLIAPMRKYEA